MITRSCFESRCSNCIGKPRSTKVSRRLNRSAPPGVHKRYYLWNKTSESSRGECNGGDFIFNAGCPYHALSIRVGEAEYKLLGIIRNGDTARLSRPIIGLYDRFIEANTVDKVVVFERAFWVVLNGGNLSFFLVERHFELGLRRVGWHGRGGGYLEAKSFLENGLYEV